jgi:phasin family protein
MFNDNPLENIMFDKMNDQLKETLKPITELATLNLTLLQKLVEKQNGLFTTLLSSGVSFAESVSQQKDPTSFAEVQKSYFETLQATVTESAKETYNLVTGGQQKAGVVLKDVSEQMTYALSGVSK